MRSSILLLIAFFLYGCAVPQDRSGKISKNDSIRIGMVKDVILLKRQLDSIFTTDSTLKEELYDSKMLIDTLLDKSLEYKDNSVELEYIRLKIANIKTERARIVHKSDSIYKSNIQLQLENKEISGQLNTVTKTLEKTSNELHTVYYKASKFYLSSIYICGVGRTSPLFGDSKEYETNKTSKIKKIKLSFTLPKNELAKPEKKNISVKFYSIDNKRFNKIDTAIFYNGTEQKMILYFTEKNLIEGKHEVEVLVNDNIETRSELILAR